MKQSKTAADFPEAPPWFSLALQFLGTTELLGDKTLNPVVRGFFAHTKFPPTLINTKTSWCAAFACSMLEQSSIRSPRSAAAIDFERWGVEQERPELGAICVFQRSDESNPRARHVGFYAGAAGDRMMLLGGNQKNQVCIEFKQRGSFLTARWPDNR